VGGIVQLKMFTLDVFVQMIEFRSGERTFLTSENTFRNHFVTLRHGAVRRCHVWHIRVLQVIESVKPTVNAESNQSYSFQ
jgi:hypothetical protein